MDSKRLSKEVLYLFNNGILYRGYTVFGAHRDSCGGKCGYTFTLWAPEVKSVRVTGSFNNWRDNEYYMESVGSGGVWTVFIPGIQQGALYKYVIETKSGELLYKADPYAFASELRPGTASKLWNLDDFKWTDEKWLADNKDTSHFKRPMNIYEVHLGSWKQHEPENGEQVFYTYRELAGELVDYVKDMGYTHIELMPVMEYPFDGSWGYQVTGYYAPTSRYGTPQDFMYFVNRCHEKGISVIMDWVPGHFCRDSHGLGRFNGNMLYESEDHPDWGTYKFDFARKEVRSFLLSNALFWLDMYHIDGLRVDGVSSMLYLNFGRDDSQPKRVNSQGGDGDLDAISFLRELSHVLAEYHPGAYTIAEESSSWPMVTRSPESGGLGFHYKWDMGWMNDTLSYISTDFPYRSSCHNKLTFSMMYAFSENFILPFSHDEVVHGKKSLIGRMPGEWWRQFAGLRLLAMYQMTHSGSKLNFMGNEFGQFIEWRFYEGLEWFMLEYDTHSKHKEFIKKLNHLYLKEKSLWQENFDWKGYRWIDADNSQQGILSYIRRGENEDDYLVILLNFQPDTYTNYRVGVPEPVYYKEIFNSDAEEYGGSGKINPRAVKAKPIPMHGMDYSISITVPPLGGTILRPGNKKKK